MDRKREDSKSINGLHHHGTIGAGTCVETLYNSTVSDGVFRVISALSRKLRA